MVGKVFDVLGDEHPALRHRRRSDFGIGAPVQTTVADVDRVVPSSSQLGADRCGEHLVDEEPHSLGGHEVGAAPGDQLGGLAGPVVGLHLGVDDVAVGGGEVDGHADVTRVEIELVGQRRHPLLLAPLRIGPAILSVSPAANWRPVRHAPGGIGRS